MSSSRRTRRSTRSPRGRSPSRRSSGRSRRRSSCASASCCRPSTLTSPSSTPTGAPHYPAASPSPPDPVDAPGLDHDQALTRRTSLSRRPLLAYVKSIKGTRDLAQVAWNFINDSLRTTIALQVHSRLSPPASSIVGRCPTAPHRPHRVVRVRSTRRDVWRRRRSTWPLGSWTTRWCCPRITISRGARSPHTHT